MISLSDLDTERWGVLTARSSISSVDELSEAAQFCLSNHVGFLITRCSTSRLDLAQSMERRGFEIMDTLVYYTRNLSKTPIPEDGGELPIRPIARGEEDSVARVAAASFKGYFGHYHADARLDRGKCDEAYTSWAVRSCVSREVADEVLVATTEGGEIAGFATLRLNSAEEGEGVLFAVSPEVQGKGVYRSFMIAGMHWSTSKGATRMAVSTQITNIAVQKVWTRVGFEPSHSYFTFHKWFDVGQ